MILSFEWWSKKELTWEVSFSVFHRLRNRTSPSQSTNQDKVRVRFKLNCQAQGLMWNVMSKLDLEDRVCNGLAHHPPPYNFFLAERVRGRSDDGQVVRWTSGAHQVNLKSQSELDISGCETWMWNYNQAIRWRFDEGQVKVRYSYGSLCLHLTKKQKQI